MKQPFAAFCFQRTDVAGVLYALGLGEIRLNSALNQPFDAEIDLVAATHEDLRRARAPGLE